MAKKKRKRKQQKRAPQAPAADRPDAAAGGKTGPAAGTGTPKAPPRRREHKEEARRARERALKRYRRRRILRRVLVTAGTILAIAGVIFLIATLTAVDTELPEEARRLASEAGCSQVQAREDLGREHLPPGSPYSYPESPATSGPHDRQSTQPAGVYDQPIQETLAVHSLEHGYVVLYYRQGEEGDPAALPEPVVEALEDQVRDEEKLILAPHPTLPQDTALALTAWNHLMTCPGSIEEEQATELAAAFIDVFRGSRNAPESNAP